METGILLIKMSIAHFTLLNLVNGNWDIINKNEYSTFHTIKPGSFNSLREEI